MDQSCGKGWRLRRIVLRALFGAGVCAALASGGAIGDSPRTHLVAGRSMATAGQVATGSLPVAAVPAPAQAVVGGALQQTQAADTSLVPGAAAAATHGVGTAGTVLPVGGGAADGAPAGGVVNGIPTGGLGNLAGIANGADTGDLAGVADLAGLAGGTPGVGNVTDLGGARLPVVGDLPVDTLAP